MTLSGNKWERTRTKRCPQSQRIRRPFLHDNSWSSTQIGKPKGSLSHYKHFKNQPLPPNKESSPQITIRPLFSIHLAQRIRMVCISHNGNFEQAKQLCVTSIITKCIAFFQRFGQYDISFYMKILQHLIQHLIQKPCMIAKWQLSMHKFNVAIYMEVIFIIKLFLVQQQSSAHFPFSNSILFLALVL